MTWNRRALAIYSLDVKPSGQAYVGPCVDNTLIHDQLSYDFDGHCTLSNQDVPSVEAFRICSSVPAAGTATWNAASVQCQEVSYSGGPRAFIDTPHDDAGVVVLRWPRIPGATYALHLGLEDGSVVDNCVNDTTLGGRINYVFDGNCPDAGTKQVALSQVSSFEIDSATHGAWANPLARDAARATWDGASRSVALRFAKFTNYYFDESCGSDPAASYQFTQASLSAETCTAPDRLYTKRRLPDHAQYGGGFSYPRSYRAPDGSTYLLFATVGGGFTPAGQRGCSELNLVRTKDWLHYDVFQIERLCGYDRLDNGEMAVIDGKMYVTYHTISGANACALAAGGTGKEWLLRMRISANYSSAAPTFSRSDGTAGFETVKRLCLANNDVQGFWEPMVYQSADQQLHVAYSDDTPPEVGDGKCNQYIRVIDYSETAHQALADVAVGACPGDLRDGMPVVAKSASGKYRMVFESPTPPDPQIVMIESADGGATWGTARTLVAHVDVDGGLDGLPLPRLRRRDPLRELLPDVQSTLRNRLLGVSPASARHE